MPMMNEAMPKGDWEKVDRGERIKKVKPIPRPEPEFPKVDNLLKFDDINLADFDKIMNATMKRIKNEEGHNFIGYDVTILMKVRRGTAVNKEGLPPEPSSKVLKGWMIEGDYEKLRRQR